MHHPSGLASLEAEPRQNVVLIERSPCIWGRLSDRAGLKAVRNDLRLAERAILLLTIIAFVPDLLLALDQDYGRFAELALPGSPLFGLSSGAGS